MRRIGICCCAAILVGCGKKSDESGMPRSEAPAADTGAAASAPAAPAAPAPISMADLQGKWKMRTMAEGSDSPLVEYEMEIGPSGLTVHLPKRAPLKGTAVVEGDSMVSDVGPYESVLRKGGSKE